MNGYKWFSASNQPYAICLNTLDDNILTWYMRLQCDPLNWSQFIWNVFSFLSVVRYKASIYILRKNAVWLPQQKF